MEATNDQPQLYFFKDECAETEREGEQKEEKEVKEEKEERKEERKEEKEEKEEKKEGKEGRRGQKMGMKEKDMEGENKVDGKR